MPLLGADTDIQVTATSQTNIEKKLILTQEVFKRDGQTNLVRRTIYKAGKLKVRLHDIYHGGFKVAVLSTEPGISLIDTKAGSPYEVTFNYGQSNNLRTVLVWTTNDMVVDAFDCKDGILSPVESSLLQRTVGAENLEMRSNTTRGCVKSADTKFGNVQILVESRFKELSR
jgi:hypothetical protein